jgi:hypothetical protein
MATFTCANPSRTEVLAKIALCSPGDTVIVPPGTASWAGDITFSGITLQGPGKDAGSPTNITAGKVTVQKHLTEIGKFSGFRFTGNDEHLVVGFLSVNDKKPVVIGDCYFFNDQVFYCTVAGSAVFHHCEFFSNTPTQGDYFKVDFFAAGDQSWADPHSMGTADTNGDKNVYFEDCLWTNFLEVAFDVHDGGRVVARRCRFVDTSIVCHGGGGGNDTGISGCKHLEVYNCKFVRVSNAFGLNKWVWWRGGTGVFAYNEVDRADSPDGFSFADKEEIRLSVGCPTPYPMTYQVGQVITPAQNPPTHPLLIFGNTGPGAADSNFIRILANPNNACATPSTYIVAGRDYQLSNTWGWVSYTYPHPLTGVTPNTMTDTRPFPQSLVSSFIPRSETLNQTYGQIHSFPTAVSGPMIAENPTEEVVSAPE